MYVHVPAMYPTYSLHVPCMYHTCTVCVLTDSCAGDERHQLPAAGRPDHRAGRRPDHRDGLLQRARRKGGNLRRVVAVS